MALDVTIGMRDRAGGTSFMKITPLPGLATLSKRPSVAWDRKPVKTFVTMALQHGIDGSEHKAAGHHDEA